jgi:hypothetical protein
LEALNRQFSIVHKDEEPISVEGCCPVNRSSLVVDTNIENATDCHNLQTDPPVESRNLMDACKWIFVE